MKTGVSVSIGRESSAEELAAVNEAFQTDALEVSVDTNYVRASADWQQLPMTVMVFVAQGVALNLFWELIKHAYKKMRADSRMQKRPPTIVVKRETYDIVVADDVLRAQSVDEIVNFASIDDLIEYEKAKAKKTKDS